MMYAQGTPRTIPQVTATPSPKQPCLGPAIQLGGIRSATDASTETGVIAGVKLCSVALLVPGMSSSELSATTFIATIANPLTSVTDRPELWAFLLSNLVVFGFGTLMTTLSYFVYRRRGRSSTFRTATLGFGSITVGGLVEPVYELGFAANKGEQLLHTEVLTVQSIEAVLFAVGFGLLVYSVMSHSGRQSKPAETISTNSRSK
ncbi:MAG: hypothetical protein ABEI76_03260 [Halobacteriales archaeon]